jgi:regulator of protease activity HflC (stomatin/prohibitin superfamily)
VFDLIRSERKQVAAALRAEGEAQFQTLTSQADRERDTTLAQADAEAERLRGQADAEATRLSNEAHARDPKFYEFLRTLEAYRAILDEKATVVLSSASPLLKLLSQGPGGDLMERPPVSVTAGSEDRQGRAKAVQSAAPGSAAVVPEGAEEGRP